MKKNINILFIGNSHTYYHEMPRMVSELFNQQGVNARITMMAQGGANLLQYCGRKDVTFNIRYGQYDFVVLQDVATGFSETNFEKALDKLKKNALDSSTAEVILFLPWSNKSKGYEQKPMTDAYVRMGAKLNVSVAPAGEVWSKLFGEFRDMELYGPDGIHPTVLGSYIAACCIFYTISERSHSLKLEAGHEPNNRLELDLDLCNKIQKFICSVTKKYAVKIEKE